MSLLGTIVGAISSAAKAYSDANKKKKTTSSSSKKSSSSSYTPKGSNTDAYIQQTNASDYNAIQSAKQAYADAQKAGDTVGMQNANAAANAIREKYGYTGGSDGSEYIALPQTQKQTNPYEEAMRNVQERYDNIAQQQKEATRLAVQQGQQRLQNQKYGINQAYDDSARQAYIANMQSKKNLPQQLAYSGATGGATETANLGLQTSYENNINNINMNRANALNDIDNAIVELQNNGDLTAAQQALDNSQQALSAYQNLLSGKINYDTKQQENALNTQLATIGQYANDYQAEIDRRMALNPNDPMIPYLAAARQEKINAQQQAEAQAQSSALEQQRELAWNLFQQTGKADDYIASILGIPVGTTTLDYTKNQYDINKPYYKEGSGDKSNVYTISNIKDMIENNFATKKINTDINVPGEYTTEYNIEGIINKMEDLYNEGNGVISKDIRDFIYDHYGIKY